MTDPEMFTDLVLGSLTEVFPQALGAEAMKAAEVVLGLLHKKQWTERFEVHVDGEESNFLRACTSHLTARWKR